MKYSKLDVIGINSKILFISNEKQPSLFKQLCIFFGQLFYYTFIIHFKYKPIPSRYKGILFFGVTLNNQRSLNPIIEQLDDEEYIYMKSHNKDVNKRRALWLSLPYLHSLLKTYRRADLKTKKLIKKYFTRLWITYGYFQLAKEYLQHYQVKVMVVSSDQGEFHRCFLLNAKKMGVKTIYVQHASVAKGFPRLIASHSFLDGQESLDKYLFTGQPDGEVHLWGGVRFDPVFQQYKPKYIESVKVIGIAINMLDNIEKVKSICEMLLKQGYQLIMRPHPRYGALNTNWLSDKGIGFSDPKTETSFDFIDKIDLMISNESSIHLDAAMMLCPTIVFNFSNSPVRDVYSYIKTGLTTLVATETQLFELLNNPKALLPSIETLQYYNASIGTPLEGSIGKAIVDFVYQLLSDEVPSFQNP